MTASALVSLMHPFYGSLLLFIIAVVFEQRKCWHFIWQLNGWRGIIQQPMLWILLMCYIDPKSIMTSIQRFRKYFQFPLAIILFNRILLYVDDPVTMEGILTAPECLNKTFMQNGFYANKGLLHAKDEKWKIRRKQLNPAFSHNTLISFLGDFNRVGHELSLKLAAVVQNDGKIPFADLEDLVSRAVLEVSCLTTMGVSTNFTQNDEKGIAAAYRHLMEITALRILKPWYQIDFLFRLLDRTKYEKTKKANKLVEDFVAQIVHEKHIEWQKGQQMQHDKGVNATQVANTTSVIAATEPQQSSWRTEQGDEQNGNHKVATIADDALPNASVAEHRIFIDQIFHLEQTGKLTLQDVMNESQSMVVVSFETVSTCIINALLCLAINHDCQVKLRQEIKRQLSKQTVTPLRHFPEDSDVGDVADSTAHAIGYNCSRCTGDTNDDNDNNDVELDVDVVENVTMSHLQRMPYLDMILNESLRLLTTVPMNLRNVSAEFQLNIIARQNHIQQPEQPQHQRDPTASLQYIQSKDKNKNVVDNNSNNRSQRNTSFSGRRVVTVPKGTMIALDTFNMQRNKDYWGTNASTFYPEYFAKERQPEGTIQGAARHSYAFIPFSKGLRTCIGHRYSIYLSKIILCKLISSFDFTTNVHLKDLQYCESVSLKYRNSKDIYFTLRQVSDE